MKTIIINEKATIKANGNLDSGNCKPVICIETGDVYTSATDAAKAFGTSLSNMSACLTGKTRTVNGKRFCYLSKANESLDAIAARLRETSEMEAKAKMWDALMAEQEAARKAEEKRIAELEKAKAKKLRQQEMYERIMAKANEILAAITATESEINKLERKEEVA